MPAAPSTAAGTVLDMNTTEPVAYSSDPFMRAAWHVLQHTTFAGVSLMTLLARVDLTGDFDDGSPGWVDWRELGNAAAALETDRSASSGVLAAVELVVALTSCPSFGSLDEHNRRVAQAAVQALALSL